MKKYIRNMALKIKGKSFKREYLEIKNINNNDKIKQFQEKKLKNLLLHSYKNVPYYHYILKEFGVVNNGRVDLLKFDKISILTKEIMREHHKELISKDYKTRKWYYNSSGGSTGEPIRFIQDDIYSKWGSATLNFYYRNMLNIDEPNIKKVILWGSERDLFQKRFRLKIVMINWLSNTVLLNSFKMTQKDMGNYVNIINSYKPGLIRGYASSLYELSKYIEEKNLDIYTPRIIISAAETLRDELKEKIETVFKTKVYDFYGSREVSTIAGECKFNSMHIFMFNNYIEIVDKNNNVVAVGKEGKIIVTNLHNYSMPLIRYEIGDMGMLSVNECKCDNKFPVLSKITGRISDHFVKENGSIIHGEYFTHLFYLKNWVKKFKVIQIDYKKIKILIIPNNTIPNKEKVDIENKIKLVMGEDCKILWNFVEDIHTTPQGKYLYTKSFVKK